MQGKQLLIGLIYLAILSGCNTQKNKCKYSFPDISDPILVTDTAKEHLFASYYGINSWNNSQKYVTVLETDVRSGIPGVQDTAILGLADVETHEFIPLAKTTAWNFQQGCMAHWLSTSPDSLIIYNDLRNGKYVSVILNVFTRKELKVIPYPVGSVSPNGREALSINFARMHLTRKDYGYDGDGQDPQKNIKFPDNDGIFIVNLETAESKLIVSYAQLKDSVPSFPDTCMEFINHALFSREGSKIFFLARSGPAKNMNTIAFTVNRDGTKLQKCFPEGWEGSHFDWLNDNELMVTAKYVAKQYTHVLFTIGKRDYKRLGKGLLDFDGHGTFSPDGKWLVTNTYPDPAMLEQKIYLMNMQTEALLPVGIFIEPKEFTGGWRCDVHCRWSPKGDMIGFNSTHSGRRQVYILKLKFAFIRQNKIDFGANSL